jgi:steroid 5-alpha reductase family enzyme
MIPLILGLALLLSVAMAISWVWQRHVNNAGWVDVFWTFATGIAAVTGALWPMPSDTAHPARQAAVATVATLWALRLGLHLRARVLHRPEDARYAGFRRDWGAHFQSRLFWFLQIQAAAALPLAGAILLAARVPAPFPRPADFLALVMIVVALAGTAVADRQLARFVADPANAGKVCDSGLWAWSRHPNYFFEWLGWCAWPVFAIGTAWLPGWFALAAPALMYWLLVHVSGIPPLERVMLASRGAAYRAYQGRTSAFFPLPPRHEVRA